MNVAFIDNFDSFTYNLVHYLQLTGTVLRVFRNDELDEHINELLSSDAIVIGPGPNAPSDAGMLMNILPLLIEKNKPILGVCLGHQALGEMFGWQLKIAAAPVHGKSSLMRHVCNGLFNGLDNPMQIGRYHSLVVSPVDGLNNLSVLEILGEDEIGQIMAFKHRDLPIWGVQFHPESVLTPQGQQLLDNWVKELKLI